jgi:hypothetical protein
MCGVACGRTADVQPIVTVLLRDPLNSPSRQRKERTRCPSEHERAGAPEAVRAAARIGPGRMKPIPTAPTRARASHLVASAATLSHRRARRLQGQGQRGPRHRGGRARARRTGSRTGKPVPEAVAPRNLRAGCPSTKLARTRQDQRGNSPAAIRRTKTATAATAYCGSSSSVTSWSTVTGFATGLSGSALMNATDFVHAAWSIAPGPCPRV